MFVFLVFHSSVFDTFSENMGPIQTDGDVNRKVASC